jgi:hypothetical protein
LLLDVEGTVASVPFLVFFLPRFRLGLGTVGFSRSVLSISPRSLGPSLLNTLLCFVDNFAIWIIVWYSGFVVSGVFFGRLGVVVDSLD